MSKPLALITNDDGIFSKGIRFLVEAAHPFFDIVVVAPNKPQSAMGHAITVALPLTIKEDDTFKELGIKAYTCSGTPADCVKIATNVIMEEKLPDIVLSGVNHGSNASISVIYSGTMAAALEAALGGIPAIGFSYCDYDEDSNMEHTKPFMEKILSQATTQSIPKDTALNINIPHTTNIKGIKICRQASARWEEEFDYRINPFGAEYYWLAGEFSNKDTSDDTDEWALDNGYISVVPCLFDLTAYKVMDELSKNWNF